MKVDLTKQELTEIIDGLRYSMTGFTTAKNTERKDYCWQLIEKLNKI